jgi:hypothetical protein
MAFYGLRLGIVKLKSIKLMDLNHVKTKACSTRRGEVDLYFQPLAKNI